MCVVVVDTLVGEEAEPLKVSVSSVDGAPPVELRRLETEGKAADVNNNPTAEFVQALDPSVWSTQEKKNILLSIAAVSFKLQDVLWSEHFLRCVRVCE